MRKFFTLVLMAMLSMVVMAEKELYGVYDGGTTLTIYYDEDREPNGGVAEWWKDATIPGVTETVLFDASVADARPTSTEKWFMDFPNLATINGLEDLNTEDVTDMSFMFYNCPNLDLSFAAVMLNGFLLTATGKVKNMRWMFAGNNGSAIYIYTLGTGSVTTMENMFYGCKNLTTLNLTNLRTQNVKNMSYMFAECPKLNINGNNDWAKFSTQSVTTMEGMFKGCAAMSYLNLSKWNTSKVTSMKEMFSGCKALKTLIVGSDFSVAGMTSQTNVFTGVTGLTIKMPTAVFDNRSTIFTSKLGFTTSNGYMINGDY